MLRSIGVAAGLLAVLWGGAAQADEQFEPLQTHETWRVDYQDSHAATACAMRARFEDGSSFELKVFGARNVMIVRVTNASWSAIALGDVMNVEARFTGDAAPKRIATEAYGFEQGAMFMVETSFLEWMTQARSVRFDLGGGRNPGEFELDAAPAALAELARCVSGRFAESRAAKRFEALDAAYSSG